MSTVPILKYLFTDVGDDSFVTASALMYIGSLNKYRENVSVIIHITNPAGVRDEEMDIFNKVQVRFGALDNLTQMRDMVFSKKNIHNHFTIT